MMSSPAAGGLVHRYDRRGRETNFAWAHRLLLLRGYDTSSGCGRAKLNEIFSLDDSTHEISVAWGVKGELRRLLGCTNLPAARTEPARLNQPVNWAAMPKSRSLKKTVDVWWTEIATFITTGAIDAQTDSANVSIENIKRTGRGYRSRELQMQDHAPQRHLDGSVPTLPVPN